MKINIIVAEDQGLIRHSLVSYLSRVDDFKVIAAVADGEALLKEIETLKPDVILMDINMPKLNGIEVTRIIDAKMPWIHVIALSMYDHPVFIREILKCGAKGFLSKNCEMDELCEAIRQVKEGKTYFCQHTTRVLMHDFTHTDRTDDFHNVMFLTPREIEIIKLLSMGHSTQELSDKLFISAKTVERHKSNIFSKMDVKNTAQLIKIAVEKGILWSE
jgi:DNA-binding NarL/FixJ family response regulator